MASGQTISVSGSGSTLSIVGTANNGTASGDGTIVYTDGTTDVVPAVVRGLVVEQPARTPATSSTSAPYLNNADASRTNQKVSLYYAGIPLDPGKTVQYVTLPHVSDGPVERSGDAHLRHRCHRIAG